MLEIIYFSIIQKSIKNKNTSLNKIGIEHNFDIIVLNTH